MLTAHVRKRLDVLGEDGQWIEIRKLPWRKLRDASEKQQHAAYAQVKVLGKEGMDAVSQVTPEQIAAFRANVHNQYDAGVLLRAGIVAWTYSEKPTPDEIDDLDAAVADWLVGEIIALAQPPRAEADAKNA